MGKEREGGKRHGFRFFVKALLVVTGLVVVIAVAGDDELRASLLSRVKGLSSSGR